MTIKVGNYLPDATLIRLTDNTPGQISIAAFTAERKVVLFGLPGAFTPTCSATHVPGFINAADRIFARGVDEIACVAVNDAYVMQQWGKVTGGTRAGITFLADADSSFTSAIGMQFDAPAVGLFARSVRYAMLVQNGRVEIFNKETAKGVCQLTSADALLAQM